MERLEFGGDWSFTPASGETKRVTLPHDAMQEEQRQPDSPGGSAVGFYPPNTYVYEKQFTLPQDWDGGYAALQFEGVYKNSKVFVNGKEAGGCAYGYIPFMVELTGLVERGAENTVRVEVDNGEMPNSRWYTGAGIYRPVWLWLGQAAHIVPEGVRISTLSYAPARILVEVEHSGGDEVCVEVLDGDAVVATGTGARQELEIPGAKLWSDDTPHLYACKVTLLAGGSAVDETVETFGIRMVEWSPKSLFINGKNTLLRGACVHHDNGILGARCFAESEERRVRILKEGGFNAIRSSHNPASAAMLAACDKYGVYMMDETWDMWYGHKNKYDYATDFEANFHADIEALVRRDFNHPSVILYSIGNEVGEPAQEKGVALAKEMAAMFRKLDPTRAVTGGMNLMLINMAKKGRGLYKDDGSGLANKASEKQEPAEPKKQKASGSLFFNMMASVVGTQMNKMANSKSADAAASPVLDALDIAGYNYASGRYVKDGELHPNRLIIGSETFPRDIAKNWRMVEKLPYLVGDFIWTGWDYLGEAGLGAWSYEPGDSGFAKKHPWLLADTGAFDILGNPTGEAFRAAAVWGTAKTPLIAVRPVNHPGAPPTQSIWRGSNGMPSWAWKGCDGNRAVVEVFSGAAKVALLLNGRQVGEKKVKDCRAEFRLSYQPGELTAVAFDENGKETGRARLQSAAGALKISAVLETQTTRPGEVVYIRIALVGENGVVESNADARLAVAVEGGELLAFGSARPCTTERYLDGCFTTYYGQALAAVRVGASGKAVVKVSGRGLNEILVQT